MERFLLVKAHLTDGYQNTQKVIQFQDVKASTVIGLSTLFSGLIVAAGKWVLEFEVGKDLTIFSELPNLPHTEILAWGGILSVSALISSSVCILFCIHAVLPRLPNIDAYNPYLLFPICSKTRDIRNKWIWWWKRTKTKNQADFLCDEVDRLVGMEATGFNDLASTIREDYKKQLVQVGIIIFKKIQYVQFGVRALFFQLLITAVTLGLMVVFLLLVAHRA